MLPSEQKGRRQKGGSLCLQEDPPRPAFHSHLAWGFLDLPGASRHTLLSPSTHRSLP